MRRPSGDRTEFVAADGGSRVAAHRVEIHGVVHEASTIGGDVRVRFFPERRPWLHGRTWRTLRTEP